MVRLLIFKVCRTVYLWKISGGPNFLVLLHFYVKISKNVPISVGLKRGPDPDTSLKPPPPPPNYGMPSAEVGNDDMKGRNFQNKILLLKFI